MPALIHIPSTLFVKNRKKVASSLKSGALVVLHAGNLAIRNGDQCFPFRQHSDFFYLTGVNQANAILLMFPDYFEKSKREILFIERPAEYSDIWEGPKLSINEARSVSGIDNIAYIDEFESVLQILAADSEYVYLYSEENRALTNYNASNNILFAEKIKHAYPAHKIERLAPIIGLKRLRKEPEEIELIKKAIDISANTFGKLCKSIKPGINEYEIEAEMIAAFLKQGAQGFAFQPIIASGSNGCYLHYIKNSDILKDGDLVLLDFGAEYANYAADISRTLPVNGKFSSRQREVYHAVLNVFKQMKNAVSKGKTIMELNKEAASLMEKACVDLKLVTLKDIKHQNPEKPLYKKYFMHGISHFIGLDVHDVGSKFITLDDNMIISCEPGLYIKEEGIGIRIENDILIKDKSIDLTSNIPIELEEIEYLLNNN